MQPTSTENSVTVQVSIESLLKKPAVLLTPEERNALFSKPHDGFAWLKKPLPSIEAMALEQKLQREKLAEEMSVKGREHWRKAHLETTKDNLAQWEDNIPSLGCRCKGFYGEWKKSNPMPSSDLTEWFFDLHDAVNEKLNKPTIKRSVARHIWRKNSPVHKPRSVKLVSSVSPKRIERQKTCIQSWLDSGFDVVLMQNAKELDRCKELFDMPVEWRVCETPRPLILDMLKAGAVINSDCEIRGDGPSFDGITGKLRWNFEEGQPAREEEWGIDCWYLPKEVLDILPDDFPYQIGKPFWDYAVPAYMRHFGIDFVIDHEPWILHETHPLNWNDADWMEGYKYISSRLPGEYGTASFRESLSRIPYNKTLGMYHNA